MKTKYACFLKESGFLDAVQRSDSYFFTFTQDIKRARLYSSKQKAARALDYRSWESPKAKEDLTFFEVYVPDPEYPSVNN